MDNADALVEALTAAIDQTEKELNERQEEVDQLELALCSFHDALDSARRQRTEKDGGGGVGVADPSESVSAKLRGMKMAEAAAVVLREAGEELGPNEILDRLLEKGWRPTATQPLPSLRTSLYREVKKPDGLIVQTGEGTFRPRDQQGDEARGSVEAMEVNDGSTN